MRCPGCNKFASLNSEEPQVDSLEIDSEGTVTCEVTLSRTSECCGEEMKTASLEMSADVSEHLEGHIATGEEGFNEDDHDLDVEEVSVESTEKGGGRYKKSFFGATVTYAVTCSCQAKDASPLYEGTLEDEVAASAMDEAC